METIFIISIFLIPAIYALYKAGVIAYAKNSVKARARRLKHETVFVIGTGLLVNGFTDIIHGDLSLGIALTFIALAIINSATTLKRIQEEGKI